MNSQSTGHLALVAKELWRAAACLPLDEFKTVSIKGVAHYYGIG